MAIDGVAIDGEVIVVGAPDHDVSEKTDQGKFYIFRYDATPKTWPEDASYAPSADASDADVARSGD